MGKGAQVAAIFLQAVKENAHPGDAGEGRPLIVADVGERFRQLRIFRIRLQADGRQLDHLRAQLVKPVRHAGDKLLRPCQNHPNPVQRTVLRPAQRLFQRAHLADNQHRRRLDVGFARLLRQVGDGGDHPALHRAGALLQNRRRHLRVHPRLHQPFADHLHRSDTHQEDQCSLQRAQSRKVDFQLPALLAVRSDDVDRRAVVPVGDGDAVVGRHRQGGGDARHDLKRDMVGSEQFQLLPAPAKQKRVAAL